MYILESSFSQNQWSPRFCIGFIFIVALMFLAACTFDINENHEFELPIDSKNVESEESILLTVLEKGEFFLFVVDGENRKTHFSGGDYQLISGTQSKALPFLHVADSIKLWDSFARINGEYYAIDVGGSPYRQDPAKIVVIKFDEYGAISRMSCDISSIDCQLANLALHDSGGALLIDNRFERFYLCNLVNEGSGITEISKNEYREQLMSSIELSNSGVELDMGDFGLFGRWCQ